MATMRITRELYDKLKKIPDRYYSSNPENNFPFMYLLGKNKKNIVCSAFKLRTSYNGCEWMSSVSGNDLAKKYIKIATMGFIPCGIARISDCLPNNGRIVEEIGETSLSNSGEYLVSIDRYVFRSDGLLKKYDEDEQVEFSIEILEKNGKKTCLQD